MKLKKGQVILVNGEKYIIKNMIEFKEDAWIWQEYEVVNQNHVVKWLIVEEDENKELEYSIYERYQGRINISNLEFMLGDKVYQLYEKGRAIVNDYFGSVDVDKYETCEYYEYMTKDETELISVEVWEDEIEYSRGYYIENKDIRITEEIEKFQDPMKEMKYKNVGVRAILVIFWGLIFFLVIKTILGLGVFSKQSIEQYLKNETGKYTYITSITNNTNQKKAKVYESSYSSIDLTVKDIIDGVPEAITQTIDTNPNTDEDGIGLQTNKEYAYIYQENGKIYIQVSDKEYVTSSGTTYHRRHYHHYYNTFGSTRKSTTYSNYAASARQKSINSRSLTGGGTSSGK
ncbi:MAG: DUF4178 domain-containing protein [Clostridia bacterium]|nr:DUF4178 domain-containing protein [Clostridia bacterium]